MTEGSASSGPRARLPALSRPTQIMIVLALLCFGGLPSLGGRPGAFVAELLLVVLGALVTARRARPWLNGDRTLLRVTLVLIACLALGQIVRSKKLFPLMPYTMYGRAAQGDAVFYEYQAERRSGRRERFRPSTVIATLGRGRIVKGLARELDAIALLEEQGGDATRERERLQDMLLALVAQANGALTDDPIALLEVLKVNLPAPYDASGAQRKTVLTLRVGTVP